MARLLYDRDMTQGRYTATKRRQVEAARQAHLAARDTRYAAMSLEDYLAERIAEYGPCADFVREANVAFWTARHAELTSTH